jgi:hypothetical protein
MAFRRYGSTSIIGGRGYGIADYVRALYRAIEQNTIDYEVHVMKSTDRLDNLAALYYGSGDLWWVIAAASGIGWGLQVPPTTVIRIPKDLQQVLALLK